MPPISKESISLASASVVPSAPVAPAEPSPAWIELVQQKVQSLQFGVVQIVVHDSQVVQVESTERHRFDLRRSK